jgi:protein-tyrosine phosphatase
MSGAADRHKLLFVCTGNICRSPIAEGCLLHKVQTRGLDRDFLIDSAGTGGWHAGERADPRARAIAARHRISLPSRARQVTLDDLELFDHLVCMDHDNLDALLVLGASPAKVHLLLSFDTESTLEEVPDPYRADVDGFLTVFRLIDAACDALLDHLLAGARRDADGPSGGR